MALRRQNRFFISYKWRVLLPSLGVMWAVIAALAVYQYSREQEYRATSLRKQLDLVSFNVVDAYENGMDLGQFKDFLRVFYENTDYNSLRVSVYTHTGDSLFTIGDAIPFVPKDVANNIVDTTLPENEREVNVRARDDLGDEWFYYACVQSTDGKIVIFCAMPYTAYIDTSMSTANVIWWFIIPLAIVASVFVYIYVYHISKSVKLLRRFVDDAVSGRRFQGVDKFPHDEFGEISRNVIALYRDKVAAKEQSEKEHAVALNAIVERSRMKREMTNNINHELKTPVGIIKGYVDTIMDSPDMDMDQVRYFLKRTQGNVDRLCTLLNDISLVTRLDDGRRQLSVGDIDFHDLVFFLADDLKRSGALGAFKFDFDIPLNTHVCGNRDLLISVVTNLARNSSFHSQGTMCRLEYVEEDDRSYTFRFYDDGIGVPPESIPKLFDRFYRVDKGRSRKLGSCGLGLPIVKSVIKNLGGAISVKNRSTGGLEFIFTLPRWRAGDSNAVIENSVSPTI